VAAAPVGPDENQEGVALPNRLRELRDEAGVTRLALALDPPTTERTIAPWEAGDVTIPDEREVELARYFGVTVAELIEWGDTESTG